MMYSQLKKYDYLYHVWIMFWFHFTIGPDLFGIDWKSDKPVHTLFFLSVLIVIKCLPLT